MMRFANHDNPLLLEALGDLLLASLNETTDAKRLAARAYLKASYSINDNQTKEEYRKLAKQAIRFQTVNASDTEQLKLESVETEFKKQLTDADQWYAGLTNREATWIREGKNADAEYDHYYLKDPEALGEPADEVWPIPQSVRIGFWICVGFAAIGLYRYLKRRIKDSASIR